MNFLVELFFLHNVLATAYLGAKFLTQKDQTFKSFGITLLLNCAAFLIWSFAVLTKPENLDIFVSIGVIFFIAALVFLLNTGIQNLKTPMRKNILIGAIVGAAIFFYVRTFIFPSEPTFSSEGFFFFNIHPLVQIVYIFCLVVLSILGINAIAPKFKSYYGNLVRYCFLIEIIGGIVLITTSDTMALYIIGWIMGLAYIALWAPPLLDKKVWAIKK